MDEQMSDAVQMIISAKGRGQSWSQHPVLRSLLKRVPSPACAGLLTGEMGQHLPVEGEEGGQGDVPKCQRRFQAVFPNTQGICFLLVVSE